MRPLSRHHDVFLHPGEFHFAAAPGTIGTLLGSCVAVTVWSQQRLMGGMCHILLPSRHRPQGSKPDERYASEAVERFVYELRARRVLPGSCQVKLFGGGNMFAGSRAGSMDIGQRNIEATRIALSIHGFTIMTEHVGGTRHRRLYLDLSNGHVWLALPQHRPT